jgi:tetratricopeptide (TPR) repeat protein
MPLTGPIVAVYSLVMVRPAAIVFIGALAAFAVAAPAPRFFSGQGYAAHAARVETARAVVPGAPSTMGQRNKALSDLYARLATADDHQSAKSISAAIERLWHYTGSDTISLMMERALGALQSKDAELSLRLLDSVVSLAPTFAEGWNRRAYVHYLQKDYGSALADLRRALTLDPNHFKALDGLGNVMRQIGRKDAALVAFRMLLDIHPFWSGAKQAVQELKRDVEGQDI